jgi:hypothetical protein
MSACHEFTHRESWVLAFTTWHLTDPPEGSITHTRCRRSFHAEHIRARQTTRPEVWLCEECIAEVEATCSTTR